MFVKMGQEKSTNVAMALRASYMRLIEEFTGFDF
jgi:hypothetical protein